MLAVSICKHLIATLKKANKSRVCNVWIRPRVNTHLGAVTLQRMASTLIYVRHRHRQTYFLDMFTIVQRMRAYSIIYVTHTLNIRYAFAQYAKGTLKVRYSYVIQTLLICFSNVCKGKMCVKVFFLHTLCNICIHNAYPIV